MSHPSKKQSSGYDSFLLLLLLLLLVQLRDNNMVWFLTTLDSYLTILVEVFTNHILAERTYFTNHREWIEHKIMVLKPANKYIIIWQCQNFNILIDDLQQQNFVKIIFYGHVNNKLQRWGNYLRFHILWCQKSMS